MPRDYFKNINRLNNEYRSLINQAASVKIANDGAPSREEGKLYQRAAEICAQAVAMSVGAAQDNWYQRQDQCERQLCAIVGKLSPAENQTEHPAGTSNPRAQETKQTNDSAGASPKGTRKKGSSKEGAISEETVASWFKTPPDRGFDQVAGMEHLKRQMEKLVRNIGNLELNRFLEMETVQSFFFYGLPGCGKTFLVEALAHELVERYHYKYMTLTGGDIHESLVGMTEKIIERMFEEAAKNEPCILFVDEIDGVCVNRSRGNLPAHVISATNAFLTGFNNIISSDKQVIFIGATNHPKDVEPAMLDRVELIEVDLPDLEARANYFRMRLEHIIRNEDGFTYEQMADACDGFSYRDMRKLVQRLKKEVAADIGATYGNHVSEAIQQIQDNAFCLSSAIFEKARREYPFHPKDKSELEKWAADTIAALGD